jgi:hypothetical protein
MTIRQWQTIEACLPFVPAVSGLAVVAIEGGLGLAVVFAPSLLAPGIMLLSSLWIDD